MNMKKIHYSKVAYKEGFDFSSLTMEQQKMTRTLYGGKECMKELYDAWVAYYDYWDYRRDISDFEYDWGFPNSGEYYGFIMHCEKSGKKDSRDYIMRILTNDKEVRQIKFKVAYNDPVYQSIRWLLCANRETGLCFENLYGHIISIGINNITESSVRVYDKPYSVPISSCVLHEDEEMTVYAMLNLMFAEEDNNETADDDC